jgi:hypothetical protein
MSVSATLSTHSFNTRCIWNTPLVVTNEEVCRAHHTKCHHRLTPSHLLKLLVLSVPCLTELQLFTRLPQKYFDSLLPPPQPAAFPAWSVKHCLNYRTRTWNYYKLRMFSLFSFIPEQVFKVSVMRHIVINCSTQFPVVATMNAWLCYGLGWQEHFVIKTI